jgi:septation ring formation regulator EzrA
MENVIIGVLILLVILVGGYLFYKNNQKKVDEQLEDTKIVIVDIKNKIDELKK